jgi:hypothetical protein
VAKLPAGVVTFLFTDIEAVNAALLVEVQPGGDRSL